MGKESSEVVVWGTVSTDVERIDKVGEEYDKRIKEIKKIEEELERSKRELEKFAKNQRSRFELTGSSFANKILDSFYQDVYSYASSGTDSEVDITEYNGILYSYLQNYYCKDFLIAYVNTCDEFVWGSKASASFRDNYQSLKFLDNKLIFLICNDKKGKNELRDFIGEKVLGGSTIPKDWDDNDKSELYKYIAVKLKERFSSDTGSIYILPSLRMKLDDLLNDSKFRSSGCKLQPDTICESIEFEINGKKVILHVTNTQIKGRSTLLRTSVLCVMEYIKTYNLEDLNTLIDNVSIRYTETSEEADELAKSYNLSCSKVEQTIGNKTLFYLPCFGTAKAGCNAIKMLLAGVGASNIVLNFKKL